MLLGASRSSTNAPLAYARRLHEGQRRAADGAPFIEHPTEVGELLCEAGATDEVIAAGLLHDALEKSDATAYELTARFGHRVGEIVRAVTDDNRIVEYSRRKAALRDQVANAGDDALAVSPPTSCRKCASFDSATAPASRCAAGGSGTTASP